MRILFLFIPRISWELSGNSYIKTGTLCVELWYFVLTRKFLSLKNDYSIYGLYNGNTINFHLRHVMDIAVLREVFVDKEYKWSDVKNPKFIIDLGAHFGDTTLFYHALYPTATIVAVEPSPENFERLVKHVKNIPQIIPIQAAVGPVDGTVQLHVMESSLGHSITERAGSQSAVTVVQLSLNSLLQQFNVKVADLIKFDIEGAEFGLFNDSNPELFANYYIGEVHNDLNDNNFPPVESWFKQFQQTIIPIKLNRFLLKASIK